MTRTKLDPILALKLQLNLLLSWHHMGQSKRPGAAGAETELEKQVSKGCQHQSVGVPRVSCFLNFLHALVCVLDRRVDSAERQLYFQTLLTDTLGIKDNGF